MKKIIIIGAGVSGLSAAWELSNLGYKTTIIESDKQIGGLAKSVVMEDYILDIGPHSFFTEDKEVYDRVISLFKGEESAMPYSKRRVKMYFRGKYVDYPLSVKSVLFQMGIISPFLSTFSFLKSYIKDLISRKNKSPDRKLTVEEWAIENFGKYLFLNFFKPYTEQFWKIKTSELSHRVIPSSKKMDFAKTLKHLLIKKYLEISRREPGNLSLVERESLPSYYPKKGFGDIPARIGKEILKKNNEIFTNCTVEKIFFEDESIKIKTNKNVFIGDHVISTIPLNQVIKKINPEPPEPVLTSSQKLDYLSLILVYIITKKRNVLNCQYCYYINKPYNRISEMNFFSEETSPKDENLLAVEISCHYKDSTWQLTDEKLFNLCIESMKNDKILDPSEVINFKVLKFPSVYPIYRKDYDKNLDTVKSYFSNTKNFSSIGRQGQFFYGDIDQMIRVGFDTARKIAKKI